MADRNRRLQRLRNDERGIMLIMAGLGLVAFMSASMLALDVGMFMVARAQAQAAADAGALAGAVALVFDDPNDRSATGPAVQNAIAAATSGTNAVVNQTASVLPEDVTFPALERVRVQVHRTSARGNPLVPFIGSIFGFSEVDLRADATAEAMPANAATCIKPWAVPDKWLEKLAPADAYDRYYQNGPNKGQIKPGADVYIGVNDKDNYTGYKQDPKGSDYGKQVLLKPGSPGDAINSSHFFPLALPGGTGSDWYGENIPGCWPGEAKIGEWIAVEPGNMTGKTVSGTEALIAKDPGARWVDGEGIVSRYHPSPRVIVIPVFDPDVYDKSREHGRQEIQIANFVGFFIEEMQGNSVLGRVVPATGLLRAPGGNAPPGSFLRVIRLVE